MGSVDRMGVRLLDGVSEPVSTSFSDGNGYRPHQLLEYSKSASPAFWQVET